MKILNKSSDNDFNINNMNYDNMNIDNINSNEWDDVDPEGNLAYEQIIKHHKFLNLVGHTDAIFSVSISPDKKFIISGSFDESIRLWSIYFNNSLCVFKGHFSPVLSVKFSPFTYLFT